MLAASASQYRTALPFHAILITSSDQLFMSILHFGSRQHDPLLHLVFWSSKACNYGADPVCEASLSDYHAAYQAEA